MSIATAATATLRVDALRVTRDRFLVGTGLYILGISLVMRWAIPWVDAGTTARWGFDLDPYYVLILSHVIIQLAPFLFGFLGGFLLLESREDRTIRAMLVSPFPAWAYLLALSAVMIVGSAALTVVEGAVIGLALPSWPSLALIAVSGGVGAPIFALFIGTVATNKTQAFAWLKIAGTGPLIPTGIFFVGEPLQWIAAIYPPYWAVKAYWLAEAGEPGWVPWAVGGIVWAGVWVAVMMRLFLRACRR